MLGSEWIIRSIHDDSINEYREYGFVLLYSMVRPFEGSSRDTNRDGIGARRERV